jgi:hypothetical protein
MHCFNKKNLDLALQIVARLACFTPIENNLVVIDTSTFLFFFLLLAETVVIF